MTPLKYTRYFLRSRQRQDRLFIKEEWIIQTVKNPEIKEVQADGRIKLWAKINDYDKRYLRVIVLSDGNTVHNAFFDRRVKL